MLLAVLPQLRHWVLWPAAMAAVVLALGFSAKYLPGYTHAELVVDQDISAHHDGFLNTAALALNTLFGPLGGTVLLAAACAYLLLVRRAPVNAVAFGAVGAVGWLSCQIFKVIVGRHRPDPALLANPLAPESASDSFPVLAGPRHRAGETSPGPGHRHGHRGSPIPPVHRRALPHRRDCLRHRRLRRRPVLHRPVEPLRDGHHRPDHGAGTLRAHHRFTHPGSTLANGEAGAF
jgi:hypothetical protein